MDKATTQLAMNACANEEAICDDAELDVTYQKLLSAAGEEPAGAAEKIRAAQRAWIAYRDAYIDAMYPAKDKHLRFHIPDGGRSP